jgi:hypothetical protein
MTGKLPRGTSCPVWQGCQSLIENQAFTGTRITGQCNSSLEGRNLGIRQACRYHNARENRICEETCSSGAARTLGYIGRCLWGRPSTTDSHGNAGRGANDHDRAHPGTHYRTNRAAERRDGRRSSDLRPGPGRRRAIPGSRFAGSNAVLQRASPPHWGRAIWAGVERSWRRLLGA